MSLINLAQIKGGKQLQADLNSLLTSYEAGKVITSIAKNPEGDKYNVDELLLALKTSLDALTGDGEEGGSVADQIEAARAALQASIDLINEDLLEKQELIDAISALVGTESVQAQIAAVTDALDTRLTEVESQIATLTGGGEDGQSIDERIDALRTELNQSISDLDERVDTLTSNVDAQLYEINQTLDLVKAHSIPAYDKFTATEGQTVFTLTFPLDAYEAVPGRGTGAKITVNGVVYDDPEDFSVNEGTVAYNQDGIPSIVEPSSVTWLFTAANGGFDIPAGAKVAVEYPVKAPNRPIGDSGEVAM
jgi:chaperonin cofactor prefoldin